MSLLKYIFLILTFLVVNALHSQENSLINNPKNSFNLELGFPGTLANDAFRKQYNGLINVKTAYTRNIFKNIIIGAYGDMYSFDSSNSDSAQISTKRQLLKNISYSYGALLGFQKKYDNKSTLSVYINVGYTHSEFKRVEVISDKVLNSYKDNGANYGISANWTILIEETFGVGPYIGYQLNRMVYEPGKLEVTANRNLKNKQQILFGLAMNFGF